MDIPTLYWYLKAVPQEDGCAGYHTPLSRPPVLSVFSRILYEFDNLVENLLLIYRKRCVYVCTEIKGKKYPSSLIAFLKIPFAWSNAPESGRKWLTSPVTLNNGKICSRLFLSNLAWIYMKNNEILAMNKLLSYRRLQDHGINTFLINVNTATFYWKTWKTGVKEHRWMSCSWQTEDHNQSKPARHICSACRHAATEHPVTDSVRVHSLSVNLP